VDNLITHVNEAQLKLYLGGGKNQQKTAENVASHPHLVKFLCQNEAPTSGFYCVILSITYYPGREFARKVCTGTSRRITTAKNRIFMLRWISGLLEGQSLKE